MKVILIKTMDSNIKMKWGCDDIKKIEKVCDVVEISESDIKEMTRMPNCFKPQGYELLLVPENPEELILDSLEEYRAYIKKQQEKSDMLKVEREKLAAARKVKRELKIKQDKIKLLNKLKQELEGEI